jgi:hypothetical protein
MCRTRGRRPIAQVQGISFTRRGPSLLEQPLPGTTSQAHTPSCMWRPVQPACCPTGTPETDTACPDPRPHPLKHSPT